MKLEWSSWESTNSWQGRERNVTVRVDAKRGKGSHVTLYYGDRKTVVRTGARKSGPGCSPR